MTETHDNYKYYVNGVKTVVDLNLNGWGTETRVASV